MNIILTILRLLHIVSAVAWVGMALAVSAFIGPAAAAAGESGLRFMKSLFVNTRFPVSFPIASVVTIVMGLLLYATGDPSTSFSQTGQIILGIGAVAGILAGLHGGAVLGRQTAEYGKSLAKYPDNQPIPADGIKDLQAQAAKVATHIRISLWIMVVALVAMASARYL
jgi:uncharacterized membrane protein